MNQSVTYQDAGVDIDAGNTLVERIKPLVKSTNREGVIGSLGGFGGLFELPIERYNKPVLVSGTDGVGTKLKLAIQQRRYEGIGIDLVAMCVNDIIVSGAEPLLFLDYYASSKLDVDTAVSVVAGISNGCQLAGCALSGGETAEMPGLYREGDFDLAGFAVGIVEKELIIDGSTIKNGDCIIGLASSGPHSNGFSLVNHLLASHSGTVSEDIDNALIEPTTIYVKPVLEACASGKVKGLVHITGGGLPENIPRVLPDGLQAHIDTTSWERAEVFQWIKEQGNVQPEEMYRVFNCGIGMVVFASESDAKSLVSIFSASNIKASVIGTVETAETGSSAANVKLADLARF